MHVDRYRYDRPDVASAGLGTRARAPGVHETTPIFALGTPISGSGAPAAPPKPRFSKKAKNQFLPKFRSVSIKPPPAICAQMGLTDKVGSVHRGAARCIRGPFLDPPDPGESKYILRMLKSAPQRRVVPPGTAGILVQRGPGATF